MRIVLTGAAGHLGSVLLEALDGPHEVVPVDRDPVDHPRARVLDVADLEAFTAACEGADALVHFAGEPAVDTPWDDVLPSNVIGVYHAFEAARLGGIERVVFASSNHAVGGYELSTGPAAYRGGILVDHRSQHWPDSLYGASKLWGEGVGRIYADNHDLRVLCLRIGACVRDDDWRAAAIRSKERWLHLDDERERLERYAAMWLSERDLVQLVERGLTADYRYAIVYGVSGNRTRFHDLEEARRVLGYVPQDAAVLEDDGRVILENGTVLTGDPRLPRSRAVAIAGSTVAGGVDVREGDRSQVSVERIDLDGRCVAPGFTDAHIHFLQWSLSLQQLDLRGSPTREAAVAAVARAAPTGEGWLLGGGWHAAHWDREPTRADLDAVAAGRPVLLWAHDHHTAWVSTAALELAGVPDLEVVERGADGQPTGLLREHAAWSFAGAVPLPPPHRLDEIVRAGVREAHRLGVTGIHDYQRPAGLATWQRLHADRRLDLRVWASLPYERLDDALGLELRTGLGDEWLRIGPIKAFADGTLGSRTASMLQPFEDAGLGLALLTCEELTDAVRRAAEGGLDIAVHAIGDAANRTVLDALEATAPVWQPAGRRPRIEHAQVLDPADLPRFAALGVTASMQPSHAPTDREGAFTAWGPARTANAYAWGALQRSGAVLAFGSDAPIEPVDPLGGVQAAVTRDWPVEQALSVEDALAGFWAGAAYARHAERRSGRLLPGYDADLVVLDRDPLTCPRDEIARIQVVATMVGGRWVHGAPPW